MKPMFAGYANDWLSRPNRISLLADSGLPYRWMTVAIPCQLLLIPPLVLTHADELVWPRIDLVGDETAPPPGGWRLEVCEGQPSDPGAWVRVAEMGLEPVSGPAQRMTRERCRIRIPAETLIFGGDPAIVHRMLTEKRAAHEARLEAERPRIIVPPPRFS